MTDTVLTRSEIVTSLASNGSGDITAQTLRNWLISSPLNTECVLLTGGSTIAGSVTATTFAVGTNGASITDDENGGMYLTAGSQNIEITPFQLIMPSGHAVNFGGVNSQALIFGNSSGTLQTNNNILDNSSGNAIFSNQVTALTFIGSAINIAGTNTLAPSGVTTTGFTDSGSTAIHLASTYKGSTGTTAYTIGDVVTILKTVGILKP